MTGSSSIHPRALRECGTRAWSHLNGTALPGPRPGIRSRRLCRITCEANAARGFGVVAEQTAESEEQEGWLPPMPHIKPRQLRSRWNASALAFLGDAVWELYCRTHFFFPPSRLTDYYDNVTNHVRAEQQDLYYELLTATDWLSAEELLVLRWGRNAKIKAIPKRLVNAKSGEVYRKATAMECLAGYLYLTNPPRLHALMAHLGIGGTRSVADAVSNEGEAEAGNDSSDFGNSEI